MKKILSWAVVAALAMTMTACGDDNGGVTPPPPPPPPVDKTEVLNGAISANKTLETDVTYTIEGPVNVESGATLTIPAGMTIKAKKGFSSYILVEMGGKIVVNGTADKPVVLTSAEASPAAGDWGGLIINGRTRLTGDAEGSTEISQTIKYGGDDDDDDSGSINYLVLEYTGAQDPNDDEVEHNGLTLNAVGRGTTIENVFIIDGSDDGIEFFGGTVDVENLLVVNPDDDMFDFTFGYSGTLTNAYGIWEEDYRGSVESDPSGVEADGNLDGNSPDDDLQSDFTIENMTIDLRLDYDADLNASPKKFMQNALRVRRGATATITGALVKGTGHVQNLVNLNDGKGGANIKSEIDLTNELETAPDKAFVPYSGNATATPPIPALTETDYPGVDYKVEGNEGCPTGIFDWTGYEF